MYFHSSIDVSRSTRGRRTLIPWCTAENRLSSHVFVFPRRSGLPSDAKPRNIRLPHKAENVRVRALCKTRRTIWQNRTTSVQMLRVGSCALTRVTRHVYTGRPSFYSLPVVKLNPPSLSPKFTFPIIRLRIFLHRTSFPIACILNRSISLSSM